MNQKRHQIVKDQLMESNKQKLVNGTYTPIKYVDSLQSTLNTKPIISTYYVGIESDSAVSEDNVQ